MNANQLCFEADLVKWSKQAALLPVRSTLPDNEHIEVTVRTGLPSSKRAGNVNTRLSIRDAFRGLQLGHKCGQAIGCHGTSVSEFVQIRPSHSKTLAKISACAIASSTAWCVLACWERNSGMIRERPASEIGILAFTANAVFMSKHRE